MSINLHKDSFAERWLHNFLIERQAIFARVLLLLISIAAFFYGKYIVIYLAGFLPVSELGSSGASVLSHNILLATAAGLAASLAFLILRPRLSALKADEQGLRLEYKSFYFPVFQSKLLAWDKISSISIERPKQKTALNSFLLSLACSDNSGPAIKIPLANLSNDESRESLADLLMSKARKALIEPGAIETIKPLKNLSFTEIWLEALSSAPARSRHTPLIAQSKLQDRYLIEKRLGGGGQATAYLALDQVEQKQVVLKESILPVYADLPSRKQALAKFHDEAIALEKVRHPMIVGYLGSFVEDHRAYLILEYIKGSNLRSFVQKEGPLNKQQAIEFALQMTTILKVLHGSNPPLVHRDFTPDNLIVNEAGKLVLIDFAVASLDEFDQEAAGKIAYMAPEQFNCKSSPQSDIYALGACLYFMLSGKDPVPLTQMHYPPDKHRSKCESKSESESESELELESDPDPISLILASACSQSASERYKSAGELEADLLKLSALEH